MPLEIISLEDQKTMAKHEVKERLYLTEDKTRLVPEGDPDARFLYAAAGRRIPEAEARRFGLLDEPAPSSTDTVDADVYDDVASTPTDDDDGEEATDRHVCDVCGKVCRSEIGLRSHQTAKHPDGQ